jgi:hypothetical protein
MKRTDWKLLRPSNAFLAAIGEATVNLNRLQTIMDFTIWHMLDLPRAAGHSATSSLRFSGRIEMLQSVGTYFFRANKPEFEKFQRAVQLIRAAYGRRNELEHSELAFGSPKSANLMVRFRVSKSRGIDLEFLDIGSAKKVADDLLDAAVTLGDLDIRKAPGRAEPKRR